MSEIQDSGKSETYDSGMVRDTAENKIKYDLVLDGPMFKQWAEHLTAGGIKRGDRNWMKARGDAELERFKQSAFRHMVQWMAGDTSEDHAAAVFFNINGAEYVYQRVMDDLSADFFEEFFDGDAAELQEQLDRAADEGMTERFRADL